MQYNTFRSMLIRLALVASTFLLASGASFAQQVVNLTAAPATAILPDGTAVPMWGYGCGLPATGSTATCAALNTTAGTGGWSPVVITVPYVATGTSLTINLTNSLSFTAGTGTNTVPTSLTIVGQLGGGLGAAATSVPSPAHPDLGVSWATVGAPGGSNPTFVPPPQGNRVQSFSTEVAAGQTTALTWTSLRPGTYLIESGTHPSIQGPMGLYGILVVTSAPTASAAGVETAGGCAYYAGNPATCALQYDTEIPLLLSEIDPVQNSAVATAVTTAGFSETKTWSGQPGGCGDSTSSNYQTCYPPAVNYTPLYYLINGVAFDKTKSGASQFLTAPASIAVPAPAGGTVLVRFVNAGLRMHVPSIVGALTGGNSTAVPPVPPSSGFSLIAEDGNPLPGLHRVQSEVFMAAGKTYDVLINAPATGANALPVYDRELSLSGNAINRDAGMLAYISVNGGKLPAVSSLVAAVARADTYNAVVAGQTLIVANPSKGVIANDTNVYGVTVLTPPTQGTLSLNENGTFTYVPSTTWASTDTFTYCANGSVVAGVCSSGITATVTLNPSNIVDSAGVVCTAQTFNSNVASYLAVKTPGVLAGCKDGANLPLKLVPSSVVASGMTVVADANGGFSASASAAGSHTFTFLAQNSHGLTGTGTATVVFPAGSNLAVKVLDGNDKVTAITDYRWVIEEDRTFYINPNCVQNPPPAGCPTAASGIVPTLGVNFHTSHMPFVAQGCTGPLSCEYGQTMIDTGTPCTTPPSPAVPAGVPAGCSATAGQHVQVVCDVGNGACRSTATQQTPVNPSQVYLDPTKRYYLSVLPGDAANPFYNASPTGHGMGGASIGIDPNTSVQQSSVTVYSQPSPYQPSKLSVFVFEDDFPLNGEHDGGGGIDVIAPNEPGLGGFEIVLWDAMGGNGDFTGQMTHDMFNQPLSNALDGTIDPMTQQNACPISQQTLATQPTPAPGSLQLPSPQAGITGRIVTCPKYEADGKTLSPLAGQAVIANLMPGRVGVVATPAADRIARGEEWLQTNTLDGQKAHDAFTRIGEPAYFQEFGPASYHVSIGFANPAIINARKPYICNGTDANSPTPGTALNCNNTLSGMVVGQRLSRTPDERLYSTDSHDAFAWTQCYVSVGDPDGEDFAFTKCNADGTFKLTGLPDGDWRITTFDQWNDQLVDGLSTPVHLGGVTCTAPNVPAGCNPSPTPHNINMKIAATQWQTNLYTKTFIDDNKDGLPQSTEKGIPFANVAVRLRDGSLENLQLTDFTGTANFNETFPLFSWYVVETDVTRYKNTGTHAVYDAGGPADGTLACGQTGYPPCATSAIGKNLANTAEKVSLPTNLRVPGSIYCAGADCIGKDMSGLAGSKSSDPPSVCTTASTPPYATTCTTTLSTGRIDNPWMGAVEGWQGFPGQNSFLEFGKAPYYPGENGGIKGHVVYASTRPFDDPMMLVQTQWEPLIPHVTINLYQEGVASDGVTPTLTLVDTTQTSSFDDWAQGFRADGVTPNMNCPGQGAATGPIPDLFFFSLYNQPDYLNLYNQQHATPGVLNTAATGTPLPNNSQFKCYDGMHNWNQLQPAPYDGMYQFPSVTAINPATGKPSGTNCKICTPDPVPASGPDADPLRTGLPILPPGKYVVEVVVPPGMELVKEEDKNILIGDNFIAPVTQQFGALGNVFILPDQASIAGTFSSGAGYNANNAQNPTQSLGATPMNGIVPGFVPEPLWPCVGEARIVPDYISLYPQTKQVAPFAGASRNLCDRKEVTLTDQMHATAKFYIYTSTHIASKFTGGITDDYTSEFDPFSPQFGEKFAPPDLPVSVKDWTGTEISRVYADHWGAYNGMTYSSWEVNPPNPTGYAPTMMVFCMNDPGPITDTRALVNGLANPTFGKLITDPLFSQGYSQFCYELPFMPGTTQYLDTPVVPTSAFAGAGYNNVDCAEPDATPAISEVDGDGIGPWVSAAGHTLTITALGDQMVPNHAYSGPSANTAPYNQKTVKRHYGFGATQGTGKVTIGGILATVTAWSDTSITVRVPRGVPACAMQQQATYGGSSAQCGQLVITAANGKQSIDTVNVTIAGKAPTHVAATASIQAAIDLAKPGDLLIVDPTVQAAGGTPASPAVHNELLLMWKPVRLQGVGASASIVNANTHPAGKLTPWRAQVDCLFGLGLDGTPQSFNPACGAGWTAFNPTLNNPQVDRIAYEAIVGWDASGNGNLAQLLQEPSLMGALEGAGITVVAKGVYFPSNSFDASLTLGFPTGTDLFTTSNTAKYCDGSYPSNFQCNPSSIDGLGITDSSQGGGGIFVHGWAHNLQIANNRVYNNAGTLSGGINLGLGEFPPATVAGGTGNLPPGSCESTGANGSLLPYCLNTQVNMHHNYISLNNSTGDELFSSTPAGAGGVSICTGSDYYKFNYNWVCGNLSNGDGGGVGHLGFSKNGDIEHNAILFNQSTNPTIPTNGGGLVIMGSPDAPPTCGLTTDQDCVSPLGAVGPSDGIGPGLVINANLIMGNAAESGSGGGVAFQNINGSDVVSFPTDPTQWHHVIFTNNIVANNVAGWDGGGISLLDALNIDIVHNTIVSNVTTASAGVLNNTLGAPLASTHNCPPGQIGPDGYCNVQITTSKPQPSGMVSINNSANLLASLPNNVTCPAGHFAGTAARNGTCLKASYPLLVNNLFWQNQAYYIAAGALSPQFQQNVVSLYNAFTTTPAASQLATGACVNNASYWDIGVRGDTGPSNHGSGVTLNPRSSLLTDASDYLSGNNLGSNPTFISQYCDGSRQPPEACTTTGCGWAVPPGISDATVPNPIFNLTPVATVDEGNNWINMRWGPLSMTNPTVLGADGNYGGGAPLGNYALATGSPAIDAVPPAVLPAVHTLTSDFFGNPRPDPASPRVDIGAVEHQGARGTAAAPTLVSIAPASSLRGVTVVVTLSGTNLDGTSAVNVSGTGVACSVLGWTATTVNASCAISTTAAFGARNVSVIAAAGTSNAVTFTVTPPAPTLTSIAPVTGSQGAAVGVTLTGSNFLTGATAVNVSGTGVTVSAVTVVNPTTVTATFTLAVTAGTGARTVSVTTPGGTSNAVTFTVAVPPPPTLASIAPATGAQGTTVPVTLTGTTLAGASAVTVSGTGVSCTISGTPTATTVNANCAITAAAALTARTVTVTTPGGTSNTVTFTVLPPTPTLASIAPATGGRGTSVPVTLTGANLTGASAVTVSGTGVSCTISGTPTATTVNANCAITAAAALTARTVRVTTLGGTSNTVTFTVAAATLASIAPATGNRGTTVPLILTGTTLTGATTVTVSGTGVTCAITGTPTATTVNANCAITAAAALTARTVTVATPGATSNSVTFTVTGATVGFAGPTPALTTATANTTTKNGIITVSNAAGATGPLTLTAAPTIAKVGTAGGTFAIVTGGTCAATTVVAAGGSCTINVRYVPGTSTVTATANITLTATGIATATVTGPNFTGN